MKRKVLNAMLIVGLMLSLVGCQQADETDKGENIETGTEQEMVSREEANPEESEPGKQQADENVGDGIAPTDEEQEEKPQEGTLNPDTVVYVQEEVCTTERVNIRTKPSVDSEALRVTARREKFQRTANDGEWSAIQIDGQEYYIASEYLMLASEVKDNGYLVVIDAGHQGKGNSEQEPIGPGASTTKPKVASGTTGISTGIPEYQLTLAVSLMLRDELEARGYQVVMIRENHDINISNAERAQVANDLGADAFIRVHANGSDDHSQSGILTACQTASNPYNGYLYPECRNLSECVLDGMVAATGGARRSIWETDSMSGINWCQVPVTIVEMGFMTNAAEDELMATDGYRYQLAVGMADGVDAYFGN